MCVCRSGALWNCTVLVFFPQTCSTGSTVYYLGHTPERFILTFSSPRTQATLFCRNSLEPSEPVREVEAEYVYEDHGVAAPMIRAVYFDPLAGWSLTVQYAGSVSGEDSPHIAYVDYVDPRRVKYRTHFSYTHPLHPTMHTMKVRALVFPCAVDERFSLSLFFVILFYFRSYVLHIHVGECV